jgi:NNP family nitrate/nitrite transporter-like MFS transporter
MLMRTRKHDIDHWDAEDVEAWNNGGAKIARRNLIWSIFAEHVGFSVWSVWSVMVLFMPQNVYHIDVAGKFFLVAMPTLVGAFLRLPYTFATATFGGRNWTMFSALVLAIPTVLTLYFMAHPATSYTTFMIVAAIAGLGGGNFASSMTNINAFYPQRLKGWALGLNAGGGNIGVAMIQIVGLLVIATMGNRSPQWVCAVYLVLLSIAAVGAALFMDNLTNQRTNGRSMIDVMGYRDSWLVALLYIGTFGSFIGFSFAFGQVLQITFLANLSHGAKVTPAMTAQAALHAAQIAFIGPLLGSIARPPGGWLSDRIGGSRVTLYTFAAMIAAAGWLVVVGEMGDARHRALSGGILAAYVVGFVALFILSGIGNGSVYKMIPSIFDAKAQSMDGFG